MNLNEIQKALAAVRESKDKLLDEFREEVAEYHEMRAKVAEMRDQIYAHVKALNQAGFTQSELAQVVGTTAPALNIELKKREDS